MVSGSPGWRNILRLTPRSWRRRLAYTEGEKRGRSALTFLRGARVSSDVSLFLGSTIPRASPPFQILPDLIPSTGVDSGETVQMRQVRRRDGHGIPRLTSFGVALFDSPRSDRRAVLLGM